MRIGPPVLRVRNIDTVVAFYENRLGLQLNRRYKGNLSDDDGNPIYELGFEHNIASSYEPLLILKHDPNDLITLRL
jgi:catechol 2,3-dioxygenase-like lactoylglutathione lyase family enzyme